MTELYTLIAIGTAATLLAAILFLLRAKFQGRRPFVSLTRRWLAASTGTSSLVLVLLGMIAISCFSRIRADEESKFLGAQGSNLHANAPPGQDAATGSDESAPAAQALESLRTYADQIEDKSQPPAAAPPGPDSAALPAVDTMIAKLVARLEKQPDDIKGWKMLGWSYLNTGNPADAERAYETALKLDPSDTEVKKLLEDTKLAQSASKPTPPSVGSTPPTAQVVNAAEDQPTPQRDSMIRGMVDKLATRLETSPNDEEGWVHLMRSRVTLGEKSAAKTAFTKALETFANDTAAKTRLTAAARALGLESN